MSITNGIYPKPHGRVEQPVTCRKCGGRPVVGTCRRKGAELGHIIFCMSVACENGMPKQPKPEATVPRAISKWNAAQGLSGGLNVAP